MARAKQHADRVNLIKRIKLGCKWPFAPVVENNGRIVRDRVWVTGRDEHHPEGRFYIESYESGKRRRKPVPKIEKSVAGCSRKSIQLNALKAGLLPPDDVPVVNEPTRLTTNSAIDDDPEYIRKHRSLKIYRTYPPALNILFSNSYTKTYVDEVTCEDILKFAAALFPPSAALVFAQSWHANGMLPPMQFENYSNIACRRLPCLAS